MPAAKPPEFRRRALDLVAQGNPVGQVANDLEISDAFLRRWTSIDDVNADRKEGLTSAEGKELAEPCRRNRVSETKMEILKRASAYFGRESALPIGDQAGPRTSRIRFPCSGNLLAPIDRPIDALRHD